MKNTKLGTLLLFLIAATFTSAQTITYTIPAGETCTVLDDNGMFYTLNNLGCYYGNVTASNGASGYLQLGGAGNGTGAGSPTFTQTAPVFDQVQCPGNAQWAPPQVVGPNPNDYLFTMHCDVHESDGTTVSFDLSIKAFWDRYTYTDRRGFKHTALRWTIGSDSSTVAILD